VSNSAQIRTKWRIIPSLIAEPPRVDSARQCSRSRQGASGARLPVDAEPETMPISPTRNAMPPRGSANPPKVG